MVNHTQKIRRQQPTNCLSVFDHFAGVELKGVTRRQKNRSYQSFFKLSYT